MEIGAFHHNIHVSLFYFEVLQMFTSTSCRSITTVIAVYRGKSSMYEYIAAGLITGGCYKTNMGLKGMAAGGLVGGALGTIAGGLSLGPIKTAQGPCATDGAPTAPR